MSENNNSECRLVDDIKFPYRAGLVAFEMF
jgi:hypothetical protein